MPNSGQRRLSASNLPGRTGLMAQRAHTRMVALDAFELLVNSTAHVLEQLAFQCAAETQHCTVFTALGFLQARQIGARGQFDFECYPPPVQRSGVCAAVFGIAPPSAIPETAIAPRQVRVSSRAR